MLISLTALLFSAVGGTYCYIVTGTETVPNVFVPDGEQLSGLTVSKTVEHPLGDGYVIPEHIRFDFTVALGEFYAGAKLNTTAGELTADENGALVLSLRPGQTIGIEGLRAGTEVTVTEQATTLAGFVVKGETVQRVSVDAQGNGSVSFVNIYTPDAVKTDNITLSGKKQLKGRSWQAGDCFTFLLEQKNGESWSSLGRRTVTYEADNADFNKFDFNDILRTLNLDKVGTYTFRVSEAAGMLENITYDQSVCSFTITVTDGDMDGKLEISAVEAAENAQVTKTEDGYAVNIDFENVYKPASSGTSQTGDRANPMWWFAMMFISGTALLVIIILDKKKRK